MHRMSSSNITPNHPLVSNILPNLPSQLRFNRQLRQRILRLFRFQRFHSPRPGFGLFLCREFTQPKQPFVSFFLLRYTGSVEFGLELRR